MHFSRYLRYWARYRAGDTAFVCEGERLSWRDYGDQCAALASHWRALGVRPGDRVGCLLPNSMAWCLGFGASALLGSALVPLNPGFGAPELRQIVADSGCKLIVSNDELMHRLGLAALSNQAQQARVYALSEAESAPPQTVAQHCQGGCLATFEAAGLSEADLLVIGYTSGTTGVPKGAMLTHRGVAEVSHGLAHALDWMAGERFLVLAPLAFTGGVILNLASTVLTGGTAYIETRLVPDEVLARIATERISVAICVPIIWQRISEAPGFAEADIRCLKSAITGGSPVAPALLARYGAKGVVIRQSYGCTEGAGAIAMPDAVTAAARPVSCGGPLVGVDLMLKAADGAPVAAGDVGEICVRGPQVMTGYWNSPEATAEAFKDGWYHTGDLALQDEHGGLVIVDRKKSMVITGGVNVYPAEVERALSGLDGVLEVGVFGIPSPAWGEEVVAVVYGPTLNAEVLAAQSRALLGGLKSPKQIRLSPQPLPKTASGKVARSHLPAVFEQLA